MYLRFRMKECMFRVVLIQGIHSGVRTKGCFHFYLEDNGISPLDRCGVGKQKHIFIRKQISGRDIEEVGNTMNLRYILTSPNHCKYHHSHKTKSHCSLLSLNWIGSKFPFPPLCIHNVLPQKYPHFFHSEGIHSGTEHHPGN